MSTHNDVAPLDAMAHCHHLLDEAKAPREIPEGRSAGLIERVAWLVSEVKRIRHVNLTMARMASDSRRTP